MEREFKYQIGDTVQAVRVDQEGELFLVRVGERTFHIAARLSAPGRLDLEVEGRRLRAYAVAAEGKQHVAVDGQTWTLQRADERRRRRSDGGASSGTLTAAMPGRVLDVLVVEGNAVTKGDTLVLLEAMKMELRVTAPADGHVVKVNCQAGQVVERGQVLVEIATD